jgi:hypothetical protein
LGLNLDLADHPLAHQRQVRNTALTVPIGGKQRHDLVGLPAKAPRGVARFGPAIFFVSSV